MFSKMIRLAKILVFKISYKKFDFFKPANRAMKFRENSNFFINMWSFQCDFKFFKLILRLNRLWKKLNFSQPIFWALKLWDSSSDFRFWSVSENFDFLRNFSSYTKSKKFQLCRRLNRFTKSMIMLIQLFEL